MWKKLLCGLFATASLTATAGLPAAAMSPVKPAANPSSGIIPARHVGPAMGPMGHVGHVGPMHSGPFFGHHHRHFRNFGFVVGVPYYGYDYYGGYGCGWLRHRALVTGSRYWWHRYEDCIGYY